MSPSLPSADGLRVLVTGAGAALGRDCARAFAAAGAELTVTDFDQDRLTKLTRELGATGRYCDVASTASVSILAAELVQSGQVPHILVNAAGNGYVRTLGMMRLSNELLPVMRAAPGRRVIVNIAPGPADPEDCGHFLHASSAVAFRGLADALSARTSGSNTRLLTVLPRASTGRPLEPQAGSNRIIESDEGADIAAAALDLVGGLPGQAAGPVERPTCTSSGA